MKIIKEGINPKTIPFTGTCSNCKTQIECSEDETKYHQNYDCRDPRDSSSYRTAKCPICSYSIYVTKKSRSPAGFYGT